MSVVIAGVDITATTDADDVLVFERRAGSWHLLHPEPEREPGVRIPAMPPPALSHRCTEQTWTQTVEGWLSEFSGGEFTLDEHQVQIMAKAYRRLIAEGKLTGWSTADQPPAG